MKAFPIINNSWADIYKLIKMKTQGNVLVTAIKWKIFDYLTEPVLADTIAEKLRFHPRNTQLFLNALAGMELIQKKNNLFFNIEKSAEFLLTSSSSYLGQFFCRVHEWHEQSRTQMEQLLINGPETGMDKVDASTWVEYTRQASAHQFCGPAQKIANIVSSLPEFSGMKKMLELGGGAGFYTMVIVSAHESLKGVVLDLPPVAALTREFIRKYEALDRVSAMEGDYTTDYLGNSYDLIFAAGTLNFAKIHIDKIFKKVYEALNPGGIFISQHDGISHERTRPGDLVCDFLFSELSGMDLIFPKGMIAEAMIKCGFRSVQTLTIKTNFGDMDIDIAKK
ncbi:methyltransferase [Desulfobacula toluolica]|uniref:O-methyltransferase, family II n=1 Tax=Desulfobacula toluolica (strain DSM 7467 / Tol2) TaxID=651182 RepID=K0NTF7_DESTT|nr:methyltransferase [Desulfobacula toluolica]CCK82342.1 O-methyltransferase, family II [Desulfobacula toluolica Tol2]